MGHYGSRKVKFQTDRERKVMGMEFQVSDVKKPLVAVWRIADKGNIVQFGPREEDNFIMNVESQEKVMMKRKKGSYVLDVEFLSEDFTRQI